MTNATRQMAILLLGVTVLAGLAGKDHGHRPATGARKAIELIAAKTELRMERSVRTKATPPDRHSLAGR